ncbi:MAG: glycosyltransferase [Casimicrobium sp.]
MTTEIPAALAVFAGTGLPRLLFVTHAWGGGVEQQVKALAASLSSQARVAILRPCDSQSVEITMPSGEICRLASTDWSTLVVALQALKFERLHLHHVQGFPSEILNLDQALRVPLDCSLHDYASICPQYQLIDPEGRYCGEPNEAGCNLCIRGRPHAWALNIREWRAAWAVTLGRADRVLAPSTSVADKIHRYLPDLVIRVAPHAEPEITFPRVIKVALLGALSSSKGLSVAVAVADLAERTNSPVALRLIGHAAEPLPKNLTATGSYEVADLPRMIAMERPDVLWLPSQVPETFSFTMSTAIASGLPVVASDLGAFPERLQGVVNASLLPFDSSPETWHDALLRAGTSSATTLSAETSQTHSTDQLTEHALALPQVVDASNAQPFAALLERSRWVLPPTTQVLRPIVDVFRVGVFGGHRPSVQVIEQRLAALPDGENDIVGRSVFDSLSESLNEATAAHANLEAEHADASIHWRRVLDDADERAAAARAHIASIEAERKAQTDHLEAQLNELRQSTSWKVTRPLRVVVNRARRLRHAAAVTATLVRRAPALARGGMARYRRGGWRSLRERVELEFKAAEPIATVSLPGAAAIRIEALTLPTTTVSPSISVVIPVYGQHPTTFACLKSIAAEPPRRSFEVVIMDDCSPDPATTALAPVQGVRIMRNETNLGFIGNVNAGAQAAVGEWLIILNNDTILRPNALNALLDTFEQHANVGLVGAKLLNADGTVQEAGGIVWKDGSAWNWGRGQNRDDPRFNFVRDADYCSGAALAIRRDLFLEMGGFDTFYAPAYYEDTDLAFRIRARGLRVLYQPAAEVFHLEGVSHGRNENSGVKAYQVTNARKFYERWQATLAPHRENALEPDLEAHRGSVSNILIVEACMITPDQDAGSVRLLNMLKILKRDGHHVTFVAENLEYRQKYVALLQQIGVEVLHGAFAGTIRKVLQTRGETLNSIMFCRHYVASRYLDQVRRFAPQARIIFDTIDLHFVREEREAAVRNDAAMLRAAAVTRAKELSVMKHADLTLVVSDFEKTLLSEVLPTAKVDIISLINDEAPAPRPFSQRSGILFIGGFRHPPNVDGVTWYITEVLPHVRRALPDVVTTIVGSNMPESLKALACDGVEIKGFVEDTEPLLLASRVSIAPLRFGAGIKGKINEAMKYGIPVVATVCAVEGMHLVPEADVLVNDNAEGFALAIVRAYSDEALWNQLSQGGLRNVQRHFSVHAALPAVRRVFAKR